MVGQRVPIPVSTSRSPGRHGNVLVVGFEKGRHAEGIKLMSTARNRVLRGLGRSVERS